MKIAVVQTHSAKILRAVQAGAIAAKECTLGLKIVSSNGQRKHTL